MKVLIAGFVALLGLLVGAAVAGPPEGVPNDVRGSDLAASPRPPTTSASAPVTTPSPTDRPATSVPPETATEDTTPATGSGAAPTDAATITTVTTALEPTTTEPSTTTTVPVSTTTPSEDFSLEVVVANAVGTRGLASQVADRVRGLGYEDVIADDARSRREHTIVYFEPGLEEAARRLLVALGLDPSAVAPTPDGEIVFGDATGELWLFVGRDLP